MGYRSGRAPRDLVLLLAAIAAASPLPPVQADDCIAQLTAAAAGGSSSGLMTEWIDAATPDNACTAQLCTGDYETCNADSPPLSALQLVFSDEFEAPGQRLGAAAGNKRWTAERMWYGVTQDIEVYLPQQVTTEGGAAIITADRMAEGATNATALAQQAGGAVWNISSAYKSGFVDSWNKFCFTGGYLETRLQLPGDEAVSGFWPAFWLMGNLGRAGYAETTKGFWPYTYSSCGGGNAGAEFGADGPAPQNISACPDPPGFDRTKFGLVPGVGRGAPEIDLLEVMVGSSKHLKPGQAAKPPRPGEQVFPHTLLTLQTAPLLPNGTTWTTTDAASRTVPGPGQYLLQDRLLHGMVTETSWWKGPYTSDTDTKQTRPGSLFQDAVGAYASLGASFFSEYHTYGLHWVPRQYIRWYIDGTLVYEVEKEALREQTNSTGFTTHERLIPVEPMYIIFNLAMSNSFGYVDLEKLAFPSQYKVDYVRVYQNASAVNLGCSPPDFPTAQYLACNRDKYLLVAEEQGLIQGACLKASSCSQEANVKFEGGDIPAGNGTFVQPQQLATVKTCCQACQAMPACGAYVYSTAEQKCFFKAPTGWIKVPVTDPHWGALAGVVYAAGEISPRGTGNDSSGSTSGGGRSGGSGGDTGGGDIDGRGSGNTSTPPLRPVSGTRQAMRDGGACRLLLAALTTVLWVLLF